MKKAMALFLFLTMCLSLTACGEKETTTESPTSNFASNLPAETQTAGNMGAADGVRPEFKEALDSYEAFFVEYCEFMKKYADDPANLDLLADYTDYMAQYADTMSKLEALNEGEMNDAELLYYAEVSGRISQMLLEASASMG